MANLIVSGAGGRMGRLLVSIIAREKEHKLVGALEAHAAGFGGQDAGELAGVGNLGIPISEDYAALARPDTVTLDFTNAKASVEHLQVAAAKGAAIVVGSTGFTPELEAQAREVAPRTRTVIAPNMSVGINVLMRITAEVAKILSTFDAEVIEIHHRTKVDAPSGTALALGRIIAEARQVEFSSNAVFGREGITGVRPADNIAVIGLRAGDAVGDHTVIFGGQGERLELIHRAQSRDSLARGALRAAAWIEHQRPGLYSMRDVLGL
jgi:4-hydroxy-tetrahydrodipicolinate reductase